MQCKVNLCFTRPMPYLWEKLLILSLFGLVYGTYVIQYSNYSYVHHVCLGWHNLDPTRILGHFFILTYLLLTCHFILTCLCNQPTCYLLYLLVTCNLLVTWYLLVTYLVLTCYLHVTYLLLICYLLVTYLLLTWYLLVTFLFLVTYLLLTCYLITTSNLLVTYLLPTCYLPVLVTFYFQRLDGHFSALNTSADLCDVNSQFRRGEIKLNSQSWPED